MSALIIALVVLVLVAIGIVVRLLIAELAKPAHPEAKTIRNVTYVPVGSSAPAGSVLVGAGVGAAGGAGMTPGGVMTLPPGYEDVLPGQLPTTTPARTRHQRKMRMRDVVERGDGVRISIWRRMRSLVSLFVLVAVLGTGAAAVVGGVVLLVAFVLEQAVN